MRAAYLLPLFVLVACGDGMTDAEKEAKEERDVAFVEGLEGRDPPPEPIDPQVIGAPDIEEYKLFGATCAFAPGDGIGAVVLAMDDTAWLKLEGRMVRLAADKGGKSLPMGTWEDYDGKEYSLRLTVDRAAAKEGGVEAVNYPATLAVRDAYDQLVFGSKGTVQCSG
jgi:hypothetical protein